MVYQMCFPRIHDAGQAHTVLARVTCRVRSTECQNGSFNCSIRSIQTELQRFNRHHSRSDSQIPLGCLDLIRVRFTCSSTTRRGLTHHTTQGHSVDPQQFANQLSIQSLFRLWQFFLVVLTTTAQSSRTLECWHAVHFKQNLDIFVIDAQNCTELMFAPARFPGLCWARWAPPGLSVWLQPSSERQRGTHVLLAFHRASRDTVLN